MTMNLRCDDAFVQDEGWYAVARRYRDFILKNKGAYILFFELRVGFKYTWYYQIPILKDDSKKFKGYVCVNLEETDCPNEIQKQTICISRDIGSVLAVYRMEKPAC